MRITKILANDLLSFADLGITNLDPQLTVVVGPNGSGKSNLVKLLRVIRDASGWPSEATLDYEDLAALQRLGTTDGFSLGIELELTEERERILVGDFVRAAFYSSDWPSSHKARFPAEWSDWIQKIFHDKPEFLFAGTFKVFFPGKLHKNLDVRYECEAEGTRLVWSTRKGIGVSVADASQVSPIEAYNQAKKAGSTPKSLVELFSRTASIKLEIHPDRLSETPEILRRLSHITGDQFDFSGTRFYTGAWLFHHLFRQGLYLTENIRGTPRLTWTSEDISQTLSSISLSDGSELALYLFRLKTGNAEQRKRFHEVCEYFSILTDYSLELTFDARKPDSIDSTQVLRSIGRRTPTTDHQQEQMRKEYALTPVIQLPGGDIPVEFAGAGAWEAAILSVFLAMRSGVLVLDEPALNLHPSRQRRLLKILRNLNRQVLLVTHSPYMIPSDELDDLGRIIRFVLDDGKTRLCQVRRNISVGNDQTKWIRWLSEITDVRSMLFARGVILVEGGTEQGALSTWFAKSSEARERGTLEDLNISVFNVGGDQQFQSFISLLAAFEIPWAIVCDGKVLNRKEKGKKSIFRQIHGAGVSVDKSVLNKIDKFEKAQKAGAACGVFTLVEDFQDEIEEYIKDKFPEEFDVAKKEWPKSKVLTGRAVARLTSCPREVENLYGQILDRFNIRSTEAINV